MAKENLANQRIKEEFQLGYDKRNREISEYKDLVQKNRRLIQGIRSSELIPLQKELETIEESIQKEKLQFMSQHFQNINHVYQKFADILPGDIKNLKMLIEAACHLQGEMSDPTSVRRDNCIALQLAGLDAGILWQENQGQVSVRKVTKDDTNVALDIFNIFANSTSVYSTKSQAPATPVYSTNHYDDDDDQIEEEEEDDDEDDDSSEKGDATSSLNLSQDNPFTSTFKTLRRPFYLQAKRILQAINVHPTQEQEKTERTEINIDSEELQKIHDKLIQKIRKIELGNSFSKSARKLLQTLEELDDVESFKHDLIKLTIGTIYHSLIRGVDVVGIVSMYDFDPAESIETCVVQTLVMCPPKTKQYIHLISRSYVTFPPQSLLDVVTTQCQTQNSISYDQVCEARDVINTNDVIESSIDGYLDYFVPIPRDSNDYLTSLFSGMESLKSDIDNIKQKQVQLQLQKEKIDDCHNRIHVLDNEMGGENSVMYGPDGVLFALRNQCYEVKNGKYIYEVCIFGNAYQREDMGDDNRALKGTGTSLGRWSNISSDDENARKIMKWTDGTGCWNGPSRSATVYVSCGSETVLLSADEPSTCEYVLTMQSHIACDENYKLKYCSKLSTC